MSPSPPPQPAAWRQACPPPPPRADADGHCMHGQPLCSRRDSHRAPPRRPVSLKIGPQIKSNQILYTLCILDTLYTLYIQCAAGMGPECCCCCCTLYSPLQARYACTSNE